MKIILIYMPHPYLVNPEAQAPLGLLYISAILEKEGYDFELKNYTSSLTHEAITDLPKADIFGITATSLELLQANRFSHLIKEKYPKSKIIIGGPGTYSYEFIDWNVVDSILIGEGEITIIEILKDFQNKKEKQIYYGVPVENLDKLPFPSRYLLKDKQGGKIFTNTKKFRELKSTVILSSRGCQFNCAFCSAPHFSIGSKKIRFRSAKSVGEEIKQVIDSFGIKQFRFSDDIFTVSKRRVLEICKEISPLEIKWKVSARVKPFDYDMANAMYNSGCEEAAFGIESFDPKVLKLINKGITPNDSIKALNLAYKIGISSRILFMVKTPGQTRKTIDLNIETLKQLPFDSIACKRFIPLPGSDIWLHPDKYNIEILDKNLDNYNFYMFGRDGYENKMRNIIKLKNRDIDEVNQETEYFENWLKSTGKLHKG